MVHCVTLIKGAMGAKFRRELSKDQQMLEEFKGLCGHEAKAKFRQDWASEKLKRAQKKLEVMKEQSLASTEEVHGIYLPFKKIWEQEGSDMEGYGALSVQMHMV